MELLHLSILVAQNIKQKSYEISINPLTFDNYLQIALKRMNLERVRYSSRTEVEPCVQKILGDLSSKLREILKWVNV